MNNSKENFFLDIFNNILNYGENKVIIIFDLDGNIWFGLKDILKMLGYDAKKAKNRFEINNDNKINYENITKGDINAPFTQKQFLSMNLVYMKF